MKNPAELTVNAKKRTAARAAAENIFYPLLAFGLFLAVWAIAAAVKSKPAILPMPDAVFQRFFSLFGEAGFWSAIGWTVLRSLISFALSFAAALILAALGGLWKPLHRVLSPIVGILRAAPTMAVILLLMLWVDYQKAPAVIGFLIAFPILYSAFYSLITGVDKDLTEMIKLYKVNPFYRVTSLYIPEIASGVFDISRSTISLTMKVVVAAEVLCQTKNSIGLKMQFANLTYDIAYLLAWTVLAIILSLVLELIVSGLKKLWEASR